MHKVLAFIGLLAMFFLSCTDKPTKKPGEENLSGQVLSQPNSATKLTLELECIDPDLNKVQKGETLMLCDGSIAEGSLELPSPEPWDIRYGVTVGSVTGKLKLNCRNMAHLSYYDSAYCTNLSFTNQADCELNAETWQSDGAGTIGVLDTTDNIDDYLNNTGDFATENPWLSDEYFCAYNSPSDPTWERVETTPPTSGGNSVFRDRISKLKWTRGASTPTHNWGGALSYCQSQASSEFGGIGNWRLPTQKEMMAAYQHGLHDLDSDHTPTDNLQDLNTYFWTSTSVSSNPSQGWWVYTDSGTTNYSIKTLSMSVLCVSSD